MKKVFTLILLIGLTVVVAGCGVKNDLDSAGGPFPRNYPVY